MSPRVIAWAPDMPQLGHSVVAIGVFDGVHLGHQALLRETVAEARHRSARAVALTFDRDPDQVVTPEAAAPQLLTLEDKCRFILESHVDTVLVVPFTQQIASMPAETFLDEVLAHCCDVTAVHVGRDFRFGAKAAGDIDTLYVWGVEHNAEVRPHDLVEIEGAPVTSTRIRRLIADGRVAEAALLLGRPTRVTGAVHHGKERGAALGFPTANILPVPYAAIPADGVYAGRAELPSGDVHDAAISIGVPPTFSDARDYVEAHLIGYKGDLYESRLTLEFVERLRDQQAYASQEELSAAIEADVEAASDALSTHTGHDEHAVEYVGEHGELLVDDMDALEAAERAVAGLDPMDAYTSTDEEWVELVGPRRLAGIYGDAGFTAALVTAPLDAAGIPHAWDPYPPEEMPGSLAFHGGVFRTFTLLVPASRLPEAQRVLGLNRAEKSTGVKRPGSAQPTVTPHTQTQPTVTRYDGPVVEDDRPGSLRVIAWGLVFLGFALFVLLNYYGRA